MPDLYLEKLGDSSVFIMKALSGLEWDLSAAYRVASASRDHQEPAFSLP